MTAGDQNNPEIWEMSYNSARDELFFADYDNDVCARCVRAMCVCDNAGDMHDVYRAADNMSPLSPEPQTAFVRVLAEWSAVTSQLSQMWSVCHMSD